MKTTRIATPVISDPSTNPSAIKPAEREVLAAFDDGGGATDGRTEIAGGRSVRTVGGAKSCGEGAGPSRSIGASGASGKPRIERGSCGSDAFARDDSLPEAPRRSSDGTD